MKKLLNFFYLLLLLMLQSKDLWACAVCFGDPESQSTKAAKAGILVLLGVTVVVLSGIGGVIVHFWRRAKALEKASRPPSAGLH